MNNDSLYSPNIVITTSRRKSPFTNTFIKALANLLGVPIIRRGTSNLDEIAYFVKKEGYEGFIVTYTRLGNPSVLTFYRITQDNFFKLFGRLFILGVYVNRNFRGYYDSVKLINNCTSEDCTSTYTFLKDFFEIWSIESSNTDNYCILMVKDLREFCENWLLKLKDDSKFRPSTLEFWDPQRKNLWLRIRVHHIWRSV